MRTAQFNGGWGCDRNEIQCQRCCMFVKNTKKLANHSQKKNSFRRFFSSRFLVCYYVSSFYSFHNFGRTLRLFYFFLSLLTPYPKEEKKDPAHQNLNKNLLFIASRKFFWLPLTNYCLFIGLNHLALT